MKHKTKKTIISVIGASTMIGTISIAAVAQACNQEREVVVNNLQEAASLVNNRFSLSSRIPNNPISSLGDLLPNMVWYISNSYLSPININVAEDFSAFDLNMSLSGQISENTSEYTVVWLAQATYGGILYEGYFANTVNSFGDITLINNYVPNPSNAPDFVMFLLNSTLTENLTQWFNQFQEQNPYLIQQTIVDFTTNLEGIRDTLLMPFSDAGITYNRELVNLEVVATTANNNVIANDLSVSFLQNSQTDELFAKGSLNFMISYGTAGQSNIPTSSLTLDFELGEHSIRLNKFNEQGQIQARTDFQRSYVWNNVLYYYDIIDNAGDLQFGIFGYDLISLENITNSQGSEVLQISSNSTINWNSQQAPSFIQAPGELNELIITMNNEFFRSSDGIEFTNFTNQINQATVPSGTTWSMISDNTGSSPAESLLLSSSSGTGTSLYIFHFDTLSVGLLDGGSSSVFENFALTDPHLTTEAFVVNGNFVSSIANAQTPEGLSRTNQATITDNLTDTSSGIISVLPISGDLPNDPDPSDLIDFNTRNYKDIEYFSTTNSLFLLPFSDNDFNSNPIPQGVYQYNTATTRPTLVVSASTLSTEESLEFLYSDNNGNLFATVSADISTAPSVSEIRLYLVDLDNQSLIRQPYTSPIIGAAPNGEALVTNDLIVYEGKVVTYDSRFDSSDLSNSFANLEVGIPTNLKIRPSNSVV